MNRPAILLCLLLFAATALVAAPFVGMEDVPLRTLWSGEEGKLAAIFECITAFADLRVRKTAELPPEIAAKIGDFTTKLEGVLDNLQNNLTSFVTRINKFLDNETMSNNFASILDGLSRTLGDKEFQQDLRAFASGLHKTLGDEKFQADLKAAAAAAPETVKSFRQMGDRVTELATRADELVTKLKALSDKMDTQVTHQGENMDQLAAALRKDLEAVNETLGNINEILARINDGKGTVGKLMTNDELHTKLIKAIDELNDALEQVGKMADGIRKRWGQ